MFELFVVLLKPFDLGSEPLNFLLVILRIRVHERNLQFLFVPGRVIVDFPQIFVLLSELVVLVFKLLKNPVVILFMFGGNCVCLTSFNFLVLNILVDSFGEGGRY